MRDAWCGFFMVQAKPTTPLPAYAGLTFAPMIALSGQTIRGTLTFTAPLLTPMTFNLTSSNANFTVPSQVTAPAGSKMLQIPVSVRANATTGMAQVTATLVPGVYVNSWSGPLSTSGGLAFLADTGLPPNYAAGFWFGAPVMFDGDFYVPTLKTYPDGRLCLATVDFTPGISVRYIDYGPYFISGRTGYNGQINLDTNPVNFSVSQINILFPAGTYYSGRKYGYSGIQGYPTYLYDNSTLTFSSDGKTATLNVVAQEYTWTLTAMPTPVFGKVKNLGTYTFTRVQ